MADSIVGVTRIGASSTRVEKVRNYTPSEKQEKMKMMEKEYLEKSEVKNYLAKNKTPEGATFAELLEQAMKPEQDEDNGYVLDIGHGTK